MREVVRRKPLPGLTALRLFAASYVLAFHFTSPTRVANASFPFTLIGAGYTAVSCFFILSGFILAYTHERVPDVGRFLWARFARIYPLYLFAFLVSLPAFLHMSLGTGQHWQLWAIPADLLLVQDWIPRLANTVNPPAWTLSCEAFLYLSFPFAVRGLVRFRRFAFTTVALLWALQLLAPKIQDLWLLPSHSRWAIPMSGFLLMPVTRYCEFFAGIVLGLNYTERSSAPQPSRRNDLWIPLLAVAVCIGFLALSSHLPREIVWNGLMVGPYCLLIWALARSRSRFLASRPLQVGGEISYGVYLLQVPFTHLTNHLTAYFHLRWFGGLALLGVYPLAWVTYLTIEKPARSLLLHGSVSPRDKPIPTPQPHLP